ncbi:MAG: F0F1 ATP synthase subunit A [Flavobacterium sp.]
MYRYNGIRLKYVFFFSLCLNYCFATSSASVSTSVVTEEEINVTETEDIDKPFNAVDMIMHHISDSNEWHLWTTTDENGEEHHVSIPLPIIVWEGGNFKIFMSSKIAHGHTHEGFTLNHGVLESTDGLQKATLVDLFKGLNGKFIDFSITKNVAGIFISIILLLFIFISASKVYGKNNGVPKGIAGFVEPIILFIRDEVALPNIGKKNTPRFLPFLLTIFFFIWVNNLMGLIPFFPGGTNVTGNIAVTMVLALITLIVVNVNGNAGYWGHIFRPPGVPVWLLPIMIPVEILGIITKPFALMMRLFANITAGHIMILSLISLVFMFKTIAIAPASIALALFVSVLELLVAALQAYIFTVLTALFIGMAVHEEHH